MANLPRCTFGVERSNELTYSRVMGKRWVAAITLRDFGRWQLCLDAMLDIVPLVSWDWGGNSESSDRQGRARCARNRH